MNAAIEKLLELHIVTVSVRDPYVSVRDPYVSVRDPYVSVRDPYAHVTSTNPTDRQTDRQIPPPRDPRTEVISDFLSDLFLVEFITRFKITTEVQKGWLELYCFDFIRRETIKATGWLSTNKHKSPKSQAGATKFMSTWLSRSWENYRKTISSSTEPVKRVIDLCSRSD